MLNVGALQEGFVLDHIKAGKAMTIYHDLKLDKLDCTVAIIKNAKSNKMGVKDIIKVECPIWIFLVSSITTSPSILSKMKRSLRKESSNFQNRSQTLSNAKILAASLPSSRVWIRYLSLPTRKKKFTDVNTAKRNTEANAINKQQKSKKRNASK